MNEVSMTEQRYLAVMEVINHGMPVTEVAERYDVSRQTVHAWPRREPVQSVGHSDGPRSRRTDPLRGPSRRPSCHYGGVWPTRSEVA
jgi:hypothetical protein